MKTIIINGQELKLSSGTIRALKQMKAQGFVGKSGDFWEGPPKYRKAMLPDNIVRCRELGFDWYYDEDSDTYPKRVAQYKAAHPRASMWVGDPRRINAILKALAK